MDHCNLHLTFSAPSQKGKIQQLGSKINSLRLSKKAKILSGIIIVVLIVSIFAALQNANPHTDPNSLDIDPQNTIDPTGIPSPTNTQGSKITPKPTQRATETPRSVRPWLPGPDPTFPPRAPGTIEKSSGQMNSSVWRTVAQQAWAYFQPGVGVDSTTGLPGSVSGYPYFTDWDLGVYIQAVLDAQKIGLITKDGDWGSDFRLSKVLYFLDNRPLNITTHYPFWFYQSGNGENYAPQSDLTKQVVDTVDAGRLFIALNNLRGYTPGPNWSVLSNSSKSIIDRVNGVVLTGRSNYAALVPSIKSVESLSNSIYAYYYTNGFAAFWPKELGSVPGQVLQNLLNSPNVTVNSGGNITLPNAEITCEPLIHAILELNNLSASERSKLVSLTKQVYLAHEERYNLTGKWGAFSEGNSGTSTFIYEWVILPGVGSWKVTSIDRRIAEPYNTNPIIYSKVALSFLALYNTSYAYGLSYYLENCLPQPNIGWSDGADYTNTLEERTIVSSVGSNTNGMVLSAARYFIQNNP